MIQMENFVLSSGILTYNPARGLSSGRNTWWCSVELDESDEIGEYYRWWMDRQWWDADRRTVKRNYYKPSHPLHLAVVRGEPPLKNRDDWGQLHSGERLEFNLSPVIRQTGDTTEFDRPDHFWFLEAEFPEYLEIRKHFGLPWSHKDNPYRTHLTIARAYD